MSHKLALISTVERYGAWDLSDDNVQGYCCKIAGTDTHGRYRAQILTEDNEHRYSRKIPSMDTHGRCRAQILTEDVVHEYRCTPIQEVGVYYIYMYITNHRLEKLCCSFNEA